MGALAGIAGEPTIPLLVFAVSDRRGIGFLSLRRRTKRVLTPLCAAAQVDWQCVRLTNVGREFRYPRTLFRKFMHASADLVVDSDLLTVDSSGGCATRWWRRRTLPPKSCRGPGPATYLTRNARSETMASVSRDDFTAWDTPR